MSEARKATPSLQPEDEGRRAAGRHDGVGLVGRHHGDGERAPQPAAARRGPPRPARGPAGHLLLDQVGQHLGVGGRGQGVPGGHELGPQLGVVLDDPVVDQGQAAGAVDVGVGVLGRRAAVGGPAGVADGGGVPGRARPPSARPAWPPSSCRRPPGPARPRPGARRSRRPPWRPRPSRSPRYSSWCRAPRRSGMASDSPVTPMMPHIVAPGYLGACGSICPRAASTTAGELGRDRVGLGFHPRLDHDPHQRLGAARAQQDPALVPELGLGLHHRLPDLGAVGQALGLGDRHVDEALGHPLHQPGREVGQRAARPAAPGRPARSR